MVSRPCVAARLAVPSTTEEYSRTVGGRGATAPHRLPCPREIVCDAARWAPGNHAHSPRRCLPIALRPRHERGYRRFHGVTHREVGRRRDCLSTGSRARADSCNATRQKLAVHGRAQQMPYHTCPAPALIPIATTREHACNSGLLRVKERSRHRPDLADSRCLDCGASAGTEHCTRVRDSEDNLLLVREILACAAPNGRGPVR
jgi:hypothetical protein